jgi:hypothetical protein
MIEYIRRYLFARAVCKKKDIKFIPKFTKRVVGSYSWHQGVVGFYNKECKVALFNEHFYAILAHELGHYIDNNLHLKHVYGTDYMWSYKDSKKLLGVRSVYLSVSDRSMMSEMKASKNARRILKTWNMYSIDKMRFLSRMLGTYAKNVHKNQIADVMYAAQRYIGSDR